MVLFRIAPVVALTVAVAACSRPMPAPPDAPLPAPVDSVEVVPEPEPPPVLEDTTAAEPEPTPEEALLAQVFETLGGRDAWREVRAYATVGTYKAHTMIGATTIETRSLVAGVRRIRAEQSTPVGDVLARVNGTSGTLLVDGSPSASGAEFAASVQRQLLFSLPYVLMNADSLTFARLEDTPDGLAVLSYRAPGIDAVYLLRVRENGRPDHVASTSPSEPEVRHSLIDFREAGGLLVPSIIRQSAGGRETGEVTISGFTPNPEIPPGAFGE